MAKKTQAELEYQLTDRVILVESGEMLPKEAFGNMEDWIIQLGERKAFLHPNLKQWMWFDRLHDEWVFAGCGVGEAILITIGRVGGVKKLPQPGPVADWCVYRQEGSLFGPLLTEGLRSQFDSNQVSKDILIWSTRATNWLSIADLVDKKITDYYKEK